MRPVVAPWQRIVHGLRIVCTNGLEVCLIDYPHDVVMGSKTYKSDAGYQFSGVEYGTTFSPGAIDLSSMVGLSEHITIPNIQAGIFDKAYVYVFATDWANPIEDYEPLFKGIFGKVVLEDNRYKTEVMSLIDLLNTTIGEGYPSMCSLRFGGQEFGGCKVDKVALQVTGTITDVTDNAEFSDSSRTEVDDYFGAGEIWFTTGPNTGVPMQRIKTYVGDSSGGLIITNEPFPYLPEIGDEYVMSPGCRLRLVDCRDKWNNTARRRAFDFIPGERFLRTTGGT